MEAETVSIVSTLTNSDVLTGVEAVGFGAVVTVVESNALTAVEVVSFGSVVTVSGAFAATLHESLGFTIDALIEVVDIFSPLNPPDSTSEAGFPGGREGRYDRMSGWEGALRTRQRVA